MTFWMIEDQDHDGGHRWLRIVQDGRSSAYLAWHEDASVAAHFGRQEDAIGFQKLHAEFCARTLVTSHSFVDRDAGGAKG